MPPTYIYATGWEHGDRYAAGSISNTARVYAIGEQKKTGSYGIKITAGANHWWKSPDIQSLVSDELYFSVWVLPYDCGEESDTSVRVEVELTDGSVVGVRSRAQPNKRFDAYRNGTWVANGSRKNSYYVWQNVSLHIKIANSGGILQSRINGIDDIDFTGDTQPGATTQIRYVRLGGASSFSADYFDDVVIAINDWPADLRFEALQVNSDIVTEFNPMSGSSNYALVDEIPVSNTDYNTATGTLSAEDRYGLGDWDGSEKTPKLMMLWGSGRKQVSDQADTLALLTYLNGVEDLGDYESLTTSFGWLWRSIPNNPSGNPWDESAIDNLQLGAKALILS